MTRTILTAAALVLFASASFARQDATTPDQRVAALKQSLAASAKQLRQYEWIETTIISLKGEEKSRKQQRCYYGADGKVQKVAMGGAPAPKAQPAPSGKRGGRLKEKIVENKVEDMQEYMEQAAALIHQYVPPNPDLVQKAKDGGKLAIKPTDGGRVQLAFTDYVQPGDRFTIDVNAAASNLSAITVATYLEKPEDTVALKVAFAALPDGTSYTSQTTLDAKAKNITVVVQNSGHRPVSK